MLSLQDERDIKTLLTRYITGIDTRSAAIISECFADECEVEYAPTIRYSTAKDVGDDMEARHRNVGPSLHRLSNFTILPEGEGAKVRTYVDGILMSLDQSKTLVDAAGYYDDHLVRVGGGWKIKKRKLTMVRLIGDMPPHE